MIWYDFGPIRTSGSIVSTLTLHSLTETLKGPGSFDEQHKFSITGANVILTSLNQREDYNSWTVPNHLKMQGVYRTQVSLGSDLWVRLWVTIVTEWVTFLKIQLMWLWLIPSQYYDVNRTIQGNVTMHMTHSVNLHSWKNTAVPEAILVHGSSTGQNQEFHFWGGSCVGVVIPVTRVSDVLWRRVNLIL